MFQPLHKYGHVAMAAIVIAVASLGSTRAVEADTKVRIDNDSGRTINIRLQNWGASQYVIATLYPGQKRIYTVPGYANYHRVKIQHRPLGGEYKTAWEFENGHYRIYSIRNVTTRTFCNRVGWLP